MPDRGVVVTGGTGLIGRPLVARLIERSESVTVVCRRPPGTAGAEAPEMDWDGQVRLRWTAGDVALPHFGLSPEAWAELVAGTHRVIHLAARTDFTGAEADYAPVNLEGARHAMELAHEAGAELHHVSTAFVCGEHAGAFAEADIDVGQRFRNPYERSKFEGERMLRGECARLGVPLAVYRPGIVLESDPAGGGEGKIGPLFYVDVLARVLSRTRRDDAPIRIRGCREAGLPLVFDYAVAEAIVELCSRADSIGRTFHLVPREPVPNATLEGAANAAFGRPVISWVPSDAWETRPPTTEEALIERKAAVYAPYLSLGVSFERGALDAALGSEALPAPTRDEVETCFATFLERRARARGEASPRRVEAPGGDADVRRYFEEFLPRFLGKRLLKNLSTFTATFWIRVPQTSTWALEVHEGVLKRVVPGAEEGDFGYEVVAEPFLRVARGELAPQECFFRGEVSLQGRKPEALRTATVLEEFFRKYPFDPVPPERPAKGTPIPLGKVFDLGWSEVISLARRHLNPGLLDLMEMGEYTAFDARRARGAYVYDAGGRPILDMVSSYGALNLGHNHPRVTAAAREFLTDERLDLSKELVSRYAAVLAHNLSCVTPGDLDSVYFCNSGAESIEAALKLAQKYHRGGRGSFVYARGSMHGKTIGALSVTGGDHFRDRFRLLAQYAVPYGDVEAIERTLAQAPKEGEGAVAGVVLEPVQGEAGVIVPPSGYLRSVHEACRRHGALLILDEVQTAWGRTGRMFGCDHDGVVPDILATAKSLGGGVASLAATFSRTEVYRRAYGNPHDCLIQTTTFGGRASACAAGIAALAALQDEHLAERADRLGARLLGRLRALAAGHPEWIADVRGRGLMIGIEFRADLADRARSFSLALPGVRAIARRHVPGIVSSALLRRHGILCSLMLNHRSVLRVYPPLVAEEADLDRFVDALSDVLSQGFESLVAERLRRTITRAGARLLVPWLSAWKER